MLLLDLATQNPIREQDIVALVPPGEPVTVLRASSFEAPRSPRGTPESWPAATRALDRLVDRAREGEDRGLPRRYWVAGRAGLPAFLYVGYCLTKKAHVTLVNPRDAGPLDVLPLDRYVGGDACSERYFDQVETPGREMGGPVAASLAVAGGDNPISYPQLTRLVPGAVPFTADTRTWLGEGNYVAAMHQLAAMAGAIQTKVPERCGLTVLVSGAATLAFLVGRALSLNIYPDLDVFQHRDGKYELAIEIRGSRSRDIQQVLFVSGDTAQTQGLTLGQEYEEIKLSLRASRYRDLFELEPVLAAQRHELLARMRRHKPEVVHICGHGTAEGIALRDDDGAEQLTSPQALTEILAEAGKPARIVVLNTCHGADQVRAVLAHAHCCIGMIGRVPDAKARYFAKAFYAALGDGAPVAAAFGSASTAADLAGNTVRYRDVDDVFDGDRERDDTPLALCVYREDIDPASLVLVRGRT